MRVRRSRGLRPGAGSGIDKGAAFGVCRHDSGGNGHRWIEEETNGNYMSKHRAGGHSSNMAVSHFLSSSGMRSSHAASV